MIPPFTAGRNNASEKKRGWYFGFSRKSQQSPFLTIIFELDPFSDNKAIFLISYRESAKVRFDDKLAIDYTERILYYNGEQIPLAKKEFDIIELLSQHIGQVFSKERIYELVWDYDSDGDSSVVAEHIRRIRSKFAKANMKQYIETVWGVGYKWMR